MTEREKEEARDRVYRACLAHRDQLLREIADPSLGSRGAVRCLREMEDALAAYAALRAPESEGEDRADIARAESALAETDWHDWETVKRDLGLATHPTPATVTDTNNKES